MMYSMKTATALKADTRERKSKRFGWTGGVFASPINSILREARWPGAPHIRAFCECVGNTSYVILHSPLRGPSCSGALQPFRPRQCGLPLVEGPETLRPQL